MLYWIDIDIFYTVSEELQYYSAPGFSVSVRVFSVNIGVNIG